LSLLQKDVSDRQRWATRDQLRRAIITWIERTCHRRHRQRGLGRLTPIEYEMILSGLPTAACELSTPESTKRGIPRLHGIGIGIGRTHARTHVIVLIDDLHARIVHAATDELLRDPTRDYQPAGAPKGPTPQKNKRSEPQ
jgi:hypothetical protein